ncbi:MAG: transglycosylase SLT domain-containing protein [Candidatus Adiutrix sp.]
MLKILLFCMALALGPLSEAHALAGKHLARGLSFCGEKVPLDNTAVFQPIDQNLVLLAGARSRIWLSLKRSDRFLPLIENALAKAKMPDDLKYIAFVTTGLDPHFNSGGRGLWRLKEKPAKALGLRIDKTVDERLDPVLATNAALRHLVSFKKIYGSWTSAAAAFLIGDEVYEKAIKEAGGEKDFYKLYFPGKEDNLMAIVLAGKIVLANPQDFGYDQKSAWSLFPSKRVKITTTTNARALAATYKVNYKSFRDMNPHLLTAAVPQGIFINVP